jgi:hypothetical protein
MVFLKYAPRLYPYKYGNKKPLFSPDKYLFFFRLFMAK